MVSDKIIAVAPMMEWTDRHCRVLHRQVTRHTLLYTEMVVAEAILHGDPERLLGFSGEEHPVAVQLGGSDPARLAAAARIAADFGYDEINLNVGCPSDKVRDGAFGACLMREPKLVADCVAAMKTAVDVPVTVKCRIGVDEQDEAALDIFVADVFGAGADGLWVHARKAWLNGLSPKENRTIPPLDYDRVARVKADWPDRFVGVNGGVVNLDEAADHLNRFNGVMIGRAAYHDPMVLADVDRRFHGDAASPPTAIEVVEAYLPYVEARLAEGVRLHHMTRHMLGLFHGMPGARKWRQIMSEGSTARDAGTEVIRQALTAVQPQADTAVDAVLEPA